MMRQTFWQQVENRVKAIKSLYEVFQAVDSERYPQMDFLYHMMERANNQIKLVDSKHAISTSKLLSIDGTIRWIGVCI